MIGVAVHFDFFSLFGMSQVLGPHLASGMSRHDFIFSFVWHSATAPLHFQHGLQDLGYGISLTGVFFWQRIVSYVAKVVP